MMASVMHHDPGADDHACVEAQQRSDGLAEAFDKAFDREEASLIRKAAEERRPARRPGNFVERSRRIRATGRAVSEEEIRRARQELRD
jgi:hypothetical protein